MRRALCSLALIMLLAEPTAADEPTPFRWTAHEAIPSRISDVLVATNLALDGWHAFRAGDTRARWGFACRTGFTYLVAELLKRAIDRERPNGVDRKSTPSMHTAFAVSSAGYRPAWGAAFALTVAWGRQAGGWHYATDTAFGAGLGVLASWGCPGGL